jgi:hypothetical protein
MVPECNSNNHLNWNWRRKNLMAKVYVIQKYLDLNSSMYSDVMWDQFQSKERPKFSMRFIQKRQRKIFYLDSVSGKPQTSKAISRKCIKYG